jgi:hypothetical protein
MKNLAKKYLFWDVSLQKIDPCKHKNYILERILNFGDVEDFAWALSFYGKEEVKKAASLKSLNKKSANFWSLYFKN